MCSVFGHVQAVAKLSGCLGPGHEAHLAPIGSSSRRSW